MEQVYRATTRRARVFGLGRSGPSALTEACAPDPDHRRPDEVGLDRGQHLQKV